MKDSFFISSLSWQVEIGCSALVETHPQNSLRDVQQPSTLSSLQAEIASIPNFAMRTAARNFVFADGNKASVVMYIADNPESDEDQQGKVLAGKKGILFDRMLESIGLDRNTVYITYILPWMPPGGRQPYANEIATLIPFVIQHIEIIQPRILILLGELTAQTLLNIQEPLYKLRRSQWYPYHSPNLPHVISALPTFHPSHLLNTPYDKKHAWHDWSLIQHKLATIQ